MSRSLSMPMPGGSSAGGSALTRMLGSFWMPLDRPSTNATLLERDEEKWNPVFHTNHATTMNLGHGAGSSQ